MKKYENFSEEELRAIFEGSESYREAAIKIGYAKNSGTPTIKKIVQDYDIDISHFKGQAHSKNVGKNITPIDDYLSNKIKITSHKLRLKLLEKGYFEPVCSCCKQSQWLENPIPLELHHINGDKNDNRLENLSLLCPNCHVFTNTYKTKNWDKSVGQ